MKRNFLFTTWEGGGNIAPVITMARKLAQNGHRVRLQADEVCRAEAEAAGLGFHPWVQAPNRLDRTPGSCPLRDWEAANPQEGIQRVMDKIMFGPAQAYARDVLAELEREPADLVVTSEMLPGVMAACESRRQPLAILAANLCLYPLAGMPVFGPGLPPPRTADEAGMQQQIRAGTLAMLNQGLPALNAARAALGLPAIACVLEQLRAARRYLLAASRVFDFPVSELPRVWNILARSWGNRAGWSQPSPWGQGESP